MAVTSRGRTTEVQMTKKWKDNRQNTTSPERRKVWTEIKPTHYERKVSVVYYLCRSGSLEHPHFMEVPLSSNDGLFLRDVINRLNLLRGKGMATMYSWSSKRSYKNGFVWQDLSENDFIYPVHGQEYVLKGSELLDTPPLNNFESTTITTSSSTSSSIDKRLGEVEEECDFPVIVRRRNQSWSSIDLNEYKIYKPESNIESAGKGADAATQTYDKRRHIRRTSSSPGQEIDIHPKKISPHRILEEDEHEEEQNQTTELTREEISPPPSSSSSETLETLIKSHPCISQFTNPGQLSSPTDQNKHSGRIKASAVLMQLISCGTISCTTSATSSIAPSDKSHHDGGGGGFSLISYYKSRLPRGTGSGGNQMSSGSSNVVDCLMENPSFEKITLEDKEYFSGSLIETNKKDEFPVLKRSSSYNADRSSKLVLRDKEIDGVRAKCIPRKPKMPMHTRKQSSSSNISMKSSTSNNIISPSSSSNDLHLGTGGGGSNSKRHSSGSSVQ